MNLAAALIFAIASAIGFALVSDRLVLAARDFFAWDFGLGIYSLLDTVRHFGSAVTGVLGGVVGYLLTIRYSRMTTGEHGFYRPAFLSATFIISLALSMLLSLIAALWGARAAGVGDGGFGWQFLGALYGGPVVGLVIHLFIFFRTWSARHDIRVSFVSGSLLPPVAAFILSLAGHFLWVSQRTATAPNHALQRTGSAVTAPAADRRRLSAYRQVPRPLRLSLSLGSLGNHNSMTRNIEHEVSILWLEDPISFPYLREFHPICTARKGWCKKWAAGRRVVAVAELSSEAKTTQRRLSRRAWYFDPGKDPYPGADRPSEAVIPGSISAGRESVHGRVA